VGNLTLTNVTISSGTANVTANITYGTANAVVYSNASNVGTTSANLTFDGTVLTVNGYMGVGGAAVSTRGITIASTALTGTTQEGIRSTFTATSAATSAVRSFTSVPVTVDATFTVPNLSGFYAANGTKGASSTITNLHGIYIEDLTNGTNNYGITSIVSSGANKWNIYASGTAQNYLRGNLGLRTETPEAQLDVFTPSGDTGLVVKRSTTMAAAPFIRLIPSSAVAYVDATGALGFRTAAIGGSPAEVMRIDSSGNVGIGTSSPTSTLHVKGSTSDVFRLERDASNQWRFQLSAGALLFSDAIAGTERMRLDSSGNLGLGVTPSAWNSGQRALQVGTLGSLRSDSATVAVSSNTFYNASFQFIYQTTGFASAYSQNSGQHIWQTAPSGTAGNAITFTQAMTLDASGNLGVGTTSPTQRLRVEQNYNGSTWMNAANTNTGSGAGAGVLFTTDQGDAGAVFQNSSGNGTANAVRLRNLLNAPILFETNNTERMRITSDGNVVIGGTSANGKFMVFDANASIRATSSSGPSIRLFAGLSCILETATNDDLIVRTNSVEAARFTTGGNLIQSAPTTPPSLATNGQMVFNLTSNTNLRVSVRGSDGVTRTANITLA
jgi:hypothetical protein